jgi:hypothetical protein
MASSVLPTIAGVRDAEVAKYGFQIILLLTATDLSELLECDVIFLIAILTASSILSDG